MDPGSHDGATHIEEVHTGPPDFSELAVRLVARMTEDPEPDEPEPPPTTAEAHADSARPMRRARERQPEPVDVPA